MSLPLYIAVTGFAIAFAHAATPTHWLPFVLVGRAQGWSRGRTLAVAGAAGVGHVAFTVMLGVLVTGAGQALAARLGASLPRLVGGALVLLGLFYLYRHVRRPPPDPEAAAAPRYRTDWTATIGLVALLTLTPSEAYLPVYLVNVGYGWSGFAMLSAVMLVGTCLGMLSFTGLCLAGADRLKLERLERYEQAIVGAALCAMGAFLALGAEGPPPHL